MKIAEYLVGHSSSWGSVNPETLKKGLGGRETAAVQLAMKWADLGHEVTLFATNTENYFYNGKDGGSANFVEHDLAVPYLSSFPQDITLSWEDPEIFNMERIYNNCGLRFCGMQVAHVLRPNDEVNTLPHAWVALSEWHKRFLARQLPEDTTIEVLPNCIDLNLYPAKAKMHKTYHGYTEFFYASSPDRGLVHVLRAWPKIRKAVPNCVLHIVYGAKDWATQCKWMHGLQGEMALDILTLINQPGIIDHGKVGQDVVAQIHAQSDFLLYPCDPMSETETGCITVIEACAAGNLPILYNADCLDEEFRNISYMLDLPYNEDAFVEAISNCVNELTETHLQVWRAKAREFAESRAWEDVAEKWIYMFEKYATLAVI